MSGAATQLASARSQPASYDALLDALSSLLTERPWGRVRMADVAERAGVSRQTIYNTFGTRDGLAQAYAIRETERFLALVERSITDNVNRPRRALRAALELFLSAAETHPLVRAISASEDGDELLALFTTRGGPIVGPATDRLAEVIGETWAGVDPRGARLAADTLVRLAISHAALPAASPRETAEAIVEVGGPYIDQLVAQLEERTAA